VSWKRIAVPVLGLLLLNTPVSAQAQVQANPLPSQTSGVPLQAVRIDEAIARLDVLAGEIMRRSGIPGMSVAVVRDGRTVFAKGFGIRKAGDSAPVDADTVFQIASISKSLAATVVARQVGAGVVAWDSPIVGRLPWFRLGDPWVTDHVTIADMFSHRSGLPTYAGDDLEDLGYDRRAVLERLGLLPLHGFRNTFAYTNFGLTAAAEAVAVASSRTWEDLAEEVLYRPLGMASTSSRHADYEKRANRAVLHVKSGDTWQAKYRRQPDAQSPAGGVSSSANDLARWLSMVLQQGQYEGRAIVSADALLPALTAEMVAVAPPRAADARARLYGYGVFVETSPAGRVVLSHSGAFTMGAGTHYAVIPSAGVGIVVLTNAAPIGAAEALVAEFNDLVQLGRPTRDWFVWWSAFFARGSSPSGDLAGKTPPANPALPARLALYQGVYANPYFGDVTIVTDDRELRLTLGPAGTTYRLAHWDGSTFAVSPVSESEIAGSRSSVAFVQSGEAPAMELTIEYLDDNGLGRFARRQR
jgi:CubicO group peptidase (beta-lactamase class C family)